MPDPLPEHLSVLCVYQFTEELMSKAPTPGGGGTAALIGSLAAALAAMAANLTIGKKKFLPFEQDHLSIIAETNMLRLRLLELMDEDAAAFAGGEIGNSLVFPAAFDARIADTVAKAVIEAARKSGAARL